MEKRTPTVAPDRPRPNERQTVDPDRDAPLFSADQDAGPPQEDGDSPLNDDPDHRSVTRVLDQDVEIGVAPDTSDLEFRGRRYRLAMTDGVVGIWDLRTGEQVGSFMEDAFSAAWARYLELEQARSLGGFLDRAADVLRRRWYVAVVVVLGALTVAYLRFEDPGLSPTLIGEPPASPVVVAPAPETMLVGPGVAQAMDALKPSLRPAPETKPNKPKLDKPKRDGSRQGDPATKGSKPSSAGGPSPDGSSTGGSTGGQTGGTGGNEEPPKEQPSPDPSPIPTANPPPE